jgi:hypothetical protein
MKDITKTCARLGELPRGTAVRYSHPRYKARVSVGDTVLYYGAHHRVCAVAEVSAWRTDLILKRTAK